MNRPQYLEPPPKHGPVQHYHLAPDELKPMKSPSSDEILAFLRAHKPFLRSEYGVRKIALFGSALRDELEADSDIDILVELKVLPNSNHIEQRRNLIRYLEGRLWRTVDLVERRLLRPHAAPYIEGTAFDV